MSNKTPAADKVHPRRNQNMNNIIIENAKRLQADNIELNKLIKEAYLVLDSGSSEDREELLKKLELRFQTSTKQE